MSVSTTAGTDEVAIPALKLVPFLPEDNSSASSTAGSAGEAVERATEELGRCLRLPFPVFWNLVIKDAALGKFVDTFLRFRRRHYEAPPEDGPVEVPESLPELGRRLFLIVLRAVGQEHAFLPSPSSDGDVPARGELLVRQSGMLAPSGVLDVCALYGRSNPDLVARWLRSLAGLDNGKTGAILAEGLGEAGTAAARALGDVHAKVAGAQYGVVGPALTQSEASDLLSYVTDVAVSVGSLLRACSDISDDHAPGQEELAALALRLQGKDGDVSPEGFAASLALTFEASLPALEALLLTGKSSMKAELVRARTRLARQWLLRCLHWLMVPVFLRPLGVQKSISSPSFSLLSSRVPATSDGGGRGTVGDVLAAKETTDVADGFFEFLTSVAAASGHLAPLGYAGSLLGEYSLRFRLADAIEQAEALRSTTASKSKGKNPTTPAKAGRREAERRPASVSDVEQGAKGDILTPTLGAERTEYLCGMLRGLPVSGEAVSSQEEASANAAAVAEAFSFAVEKGGIRQVDTRGVGSLDERGRPHDPEELDDMIKSILAVFGGPGEAGGLGEGFVEACLSVFGWSPQAVIEAVLEDRLPPQVASLDRGLRRAWKGKKGDLDKAYRVDKALAAAEAKRLIALERRQEEDAYLLSREYDDDYDDQYDDREVYVGGGGGGGLDDMETVRRVNQLIRQEEDEDAWWEQNKNENLSYATRLGGGRKGITNQSEDLGNESENENEANTEVGGSHGGGWGGGGRGRGRAAPGGGRGGSSEGSRGGSSQWGRGRNAGIGGVGGGRSRGTGGGRGASRQGDASTVGELGGRGGGRGGGGGGTEMDRIQQRRKGQNKAAVGNHNRKNAARKKEAKGMF